MEGSNMKKVVFDCSTGESQYIDLTAEEVSALEAAAIADQQEREAKIVADAAAAVIRESARAKLEALGLTEAEVAALVK
jgi:hypothetical protein